MEILCQPYLINIHSYFGTDTIPQVMNFNNNVEASSAVFMFTVQATIVDIDKEARLLSYKVYCQDVLIPSWQKSWFWCKDTEAIYDMR